MMPWHATQDDMMRVTYDNTSQRDVTERMYIGMSDEYVPNDARYDTDTDTFGHDYMSVADGLFALMLG